MRHYLLVELQDIDLQLSKKITPTKDVFLLIFQEWLLERVKIILKLFAKKVNYFLNKTPS